MAEIGLAASIIGVASAGAKLSLALYQFAEIVGSAASEVRSVAGDISIFCSVLHQLDATLQEAKATRYSLTAITTAEAIVGECRNIFNQIQAVVDKLKRESVDTPQELTLAWTARVKWVFQRSKVSLHQSKLESMKATLLLMLTALAMARRASVGQYETLKNSSEQALAQSLVITQQAALDKLRKEEELEAQVDGLAQEEGAHVLSGMSSSTTIRYLEVQGHSSTPTGDLCVDSQAMKKRNRTSQIIHGQIAGSGVSSKLESNLQTEEQWKADRLTFQQDIPGPASDYDFAKFSTVNDRRSVDSTWLSKAIFDDGLTPAERHESWVGNSAMNLANNLINSLLSRWIDHPINSLLQASSSGVKTDANLGKPSSKGVSNAKSPLWWKTRRSPELSPRPPESSEQASRPSLPVAYVFKNSALRLSLADQTDTVLLKYLRMFNHSADPDEFSLSIEYENGDSNDRIEEELHPRSYPLTIFANKSTKGTLPQFLLRKKGTGEESKLWIKRIVPLDAI
jgi:hypothetical protein